MKTPSLRMMTSIRLLLQLHPMGSGPKRCSSSNLPSGHPFPDVTVKITEPSALSKRQKFKRVTISAPVLRHLDRLDLGFVPRSKRRKLTLPVVHAPPKPPPPFYSIGERFASARAWNELPKNRSRSAEIALVGRSNVGKSTLLNVLLNLRRRPQKRATVSDTPGETKSLDFYAIGRPGPLTLVDFPGYGFSYASGEQVDGWSALMVAYLRHRNGPKGKAGPGDAGDSDPNPLKRLVLLVDARHGLKMIDKEFLAVVYDRHHSVSPIPPDVKLPASRVEAGNRRKGGGSAIGVQSKAARQVLPPRALLLDAADQASPYLENDLLGAGAPFGEKGFGEGEERLGLDLAAAAARPPSCRWC